MGGCASKPKEVDGDAPEAAPVVAETVTEVVAETREDKEEPQADEPQPAEAGKKEEVVAAPAAAAAEAVPNAEHVVVEEVVNKGEEKGKETDALETKEIKPTES